MQKQALAGIKMVGFMYAGVGTLTLKPFAEHGATTVRVESNGRLCILRTSPPFKDDKPGMNRSLYYAICNNDRLSMGLSITHPRAHEVAERLVKWADVVVENLTPGLMGRWGLSYEDLRKIKPDIIMYSASLLGQTGPYRSARGFGPVLQVYSGFSSITGFPEGKPLVVGQSPPDFIAPPLGALAILAALDYKRRTGKGQYIDLSELETAILGLSPALLDYTVNGRIASRAGNSCSYAAPHNVYRCKGNDRWCVIAVFTDEEWQAFCDVIGNPEWTREARFQTLLGRKENEAALDQLIEKWTINYPPEEIMVKMQTAGVAAGVVQNVEDVCEHCPQVKHRKLFWTLDHVEMGPQPYIAPAAILSKTPRELKRAAPCMKEHTEYVCKELLGMPEEDYVSYLVDGVFE